MVFPKLDQAVPNFPELERKVLELWKERDVFHRSLGETEGKPDFVFYEGPPTANGLPHNGHVLTRVIKDLFPRYMTMRGYHVERRAGWDTHGLPVEVEVEKELRISGKEAIVEYGVEQFSRKCIESVFRYTNEWEHLTERIGFWVDLDKAYVTFHKSYVESVWWALSRLFEKGLLYRGHKVVWWWAQGGTALSSGEVGNAYKTVDDPSVYVRFPFVDEDASLVVWTTTPWTLPSNMFVGVHGEFEYAYVEDPETGNTLVLAEGLVESLAEKLKRDLKVVKTVKGESLFGKRYRPPFDVYSRDVAAADDRYWRVIPGDRSNTSSRDYFVTLEAGTGVVHLAPAFGEDDWKAWRNEKQKNDAIEMLCAVGPDGKFTDRMAEHGFEGVWVKDADKGIIRYLKEQGLVVHSELYRHDYPFCWRSDDDPLIQYAREAWFIRTTALIDRVIENNQKVVWQPEHIRDGRFGDFLDGNVDWALSRERFWGTPLNIWECEDCGNTEAPDSCAAIEARNPEAFKVFREAREKDPTLSEHLIIHKPWIDQVSYPCSECGGVMRRVPEVIDCWFDSGCMPFAQLGYPHAPDSEEAFARSFPADFISEAIDQTRGWFYSLMTISNLIFSEEKSPHPYRRCIVLGHVLDKVGKKESKSRGNYTPPEVILDSVRMEFAPISGKAPYAKHLEALKKGEALIAQEDLEGLDLKPGAEVVLYRRDSPQTRRKVKLRAVPKPKKANDPVFPRRVILMSATDKKALKLSFGPADARPAEVPKLPPNQRVLVAYEGVPAPGADAFRWFFYASGPPWNNTRHSLPNVRTLQKELPIKLRNVYVFFTTYANIDSFDPVADEASKRSSKDRALLDRWVLSELERTKLMVVEHMDAFRSYEATQVLNAFVDGLSNWYVRRSRDRFWAPGRAQDKLDAFWTLYQCLHDLALMLAPFLPFAAEDMYQALVVDVYGEGHPDSVHLRLYPTGDASRIDYELSADMQDVRDLVSLGLQVRANYKLKTRQPLAEAEIILSKPERAEALNAYADIMSEELNVKAVKFTEEADQYVSYKVKPDFKALGRRLGPKMKATQKAIGGENPDRLKRALDTAGQVALTVEGSQLTLTREELVVSVEAKEGFAAATAPIGVVVLNTQLTDELRAEGLFREVLARVQAHRKQLKLDFADRIKLGLSGSAELLDVCSARQDELKAETLTLDLRLDEQVGGEPIEVQVDGHPLVIDIIVSASKTGSQAGSKTGSQAGSQAKDRAKEKQSPAQREH